MIEQLLDSAFAIDLKTIESNLSSKQEDVWDDKSRL